MDPALTLKGFGAVGAVVSAIAGIFLAAEAAEGHLGKRFVRAVVYPIPITAVGLLILILGAQTGLHRAFLWVSLLLLLLTAIVAACFYAGKPPATGPKDLRWAWVLLVLGFGLSLVQTVGEFVWAALGNK